MKEILERLEQQDDTIQEMRLMIADMRDAIPLSGADILAEFHSHRTLLESILVDEFNLPSADVLYLKKKPGSANIPRMPRGGMNFVDQAPERVALILLFYILMQHNRYASRSHLKDIYGYSAGRSHEFMLRIEASASGRKHRRNAEREFLDRIGRSSEPVTEISATSLYRACQQKIRAAHLGIQYVRSDANLYAKEATPRHLKD